MNLLVRSPLFNASKSRGLTPAGTGRGDTLRELPAPLIPTPRVNLTRFHGVFAPNCRLRAQIVPGKPQSECPCKGASGPSEVVRRRPIP